MPVSAETYIAFLSVMVAMSIMPGPAMLFALAAGVSRGPRGVILATMGMNLAALMWFAGSVFGLMVLAATVPWLFRLFGWFGVAYIAWLGIDALRGALHPAPPAPRAMKAPGLSIFRDGFIVQATNPKALLFFTAILPPFIDASRALWPQMSLYAATFFISDISVMVAYGLAGVAFAHKLEEPRFRRLFALFIGAILLTVALLMARRLVG